MHYTRTRIGTDPRVVHAEDETEQYGQSEIVELLHSLYCTNHA